MSPSSIFKDLHLPDRVVKMLEERLVEKSYQKGEILLKPGEIVRYQCYVIDGCLCSYFIDQAAKEHIVQFAISDWWISDYTAFYKQEKSILHIECIQNATVLRLSRDDMHYLFDQCAEIERFFRLKTESYISSFQKRIIGDLAKPAKARYEDFIRTYPNIEQSVKNYHIASYLGITSESLSRIRKELSSK